MNASQFNDMSLDGTRTSGQDVRNQNVTAAMAIANVVKSSLGPVGLGTFNSTFVLSKWLFGSTGGYVPYTTVSLVVPAICLLKNPCERPTFVSSNNRPLSNRIRLKGKGDC